MAVFVSADEDANDWGVLNEIICAWREDEQRTRQECGLDPVETNYTGCPNYHTTDRNLQQRQTATERLSVNEILIRNRMHLSVDPFSETHNIRVDDTDLEGTSLHPPQRTLLYDFNGSKEPDWHNYFALEDVKTEYYYRYSGTQTIPPCYGTFYEGDNRRQTNHWVRFNPSYTVSFLTPFFFFFVVPCHV